MAAVLRVNGRCHHSAAPESAPLIDVLRDELGLKATRFGCGRNQCGACHVLIDGRSQPACDTPLWACAGRDIVTLEGLAEDRLAQALAAALIEEQAGQCAYCLSGIQASAIEFLRAHPRPTDAEVRAALDRHLCRCGSHNRIVRAVLRVAREAR